MSRFDTVPQRPDISRGSLRSPSTQMGGSMQEMKRAPEALKPELLAKDLVDVRSIDELIEVIKKTSGIRNSDGKLISEKYMIENLYGIKQALTNTGSTPASGMGGLAEMFANTFSSMQGLREKVRQILAPGSLPVERVKKVELPRDIQSIATEKMGRANTFAEIRGALEGITQVYEHGLVYSKQDIEDEVRRMELLVGDNQFQPARNRLNQLKYPLGMYQTLSRLVNDGENVFLKSLNQQVPSPEPRPRVREAKGGIMDREALLMDVNVSAKDRLLLVGSIKDVQLVMGTIGALKSGGREYTSEQIVPMIDRVSMAIITGKQERVEEALAQVPSQTLRNALRQAAGYELKKQRN